MNRNRSEFRILVVDADDEYRRKTKQRLDQSQFQVLEAVDGRQALGALKREHVDLLISNLTLPRGATADLLLQFIRENQLNTHSIVVSAEMELEIAKKYMKLGAADFLEKAPDFTELLTTVENIFGSTNGRSTATESAPSKPIKRAPKIGGYKVIKTLAEGNMGKIYLVEKHEGTEVCRFALKTIKINNLTDVDPREYTERFVIEAETASKFKHPNIVDVIDFGIDDETATPFIVMEYVQGKSLKRYVGHPEILSFQDKVQMLIQVAKALSALHDQGICHRDLKPENILVTVIGTVKLLDFGVVKLPESKLTMSEWIMGTPLYQAPEAFLTYKVDQRSDIFSLGVVAYEFLLGRAPFSGSSVQSVGYDICNKAPVGPRKLANRFPLKLQLILARMLKKNVADRYQSIHDVIRDLREYLTSNQSAGVKSINYRVKTLCSSVAKMFGDDDWS